MARHLKFQQNLLLRVVKILSGTNLGMLIENVMMRDMDINFDELVETAISTGKQQVLKFEMCRETEADQQGI